MSKFNEMSSAMQEAEETMRVADRMANRLAQLLKGRLRHVGNYTLAALKRELKGFNAHTGVWRDDQC